MSISKLVHFESTIDGHGPKPENDQFANRRVLVVLRWPIGGIRSYLLYNYQWMAKNGFSATFLGPSDDAFRSFCNEFQGCNGVEFIEAPLRNGKCDLRSAANRLIRTGKFSLIHSQGPISAISVVL